MNKQELFNYINIKINEAIEEAKTTIDKTTRLNKYHDAKQKLFNELDILMNEYNDIKSKRSALLQDMEQEATPEGGKVTDDYGVQLDLYNYNLKTLIPKINKLRTKIKNTSL